MSRPPVFIPSVPPHLRKHGILTGFTGGMLHTDYTGERPFETMQRCVGKNALEILDMEDVYFTYRAFMITRAGVLDDTTLRLISCSAASSVLHVIESKHPDDIRPRTAIETSVRYALGDATDEELERARDDLSDMSYERTLPPEYYDSVIYAAGPPVRTRIDTYSAMHFAFFATLDAKPLIETIRKVINGNNNRQISTTQG